MNQKRFAFYLGVFATCFGLLRIPAVFLRIPGLTHFALTFGVSVFPDPYNHPSTEDPKDPYRGLTFGCEKNGQVTHRAAWSYLTRGALSGPHRRTMSFGGYFNLLFVDRHGEREERFEKLTRYYFCNHGPLAEMLNCPLDTDAALIVVTDSQYGQVTHEARVSCEN